LPFLSNFPKNFSIFTSYHAVFQLLNFGSDENIGNHRGTHERSRCNYLAAEPSGSPRISQNYHFPRYQHFSDFQGKGF